MNNDSPTSDPSPPVRRRIRLRRAAGTLLRSFVPPKSGVDLAETDMVVTDAHFAAPLCRNCGKPCTTPYCSGCGQGMSKRLSYGDLWQEFWQSKRLFQMGVLHTLLRLFTQPGVVAREYVLGARKRHVHPFTLLVFAVGLLVLMLGRTNYLLAGQEQLGPVMAQVATWSRWSFTLGLFALFIAGLVVFWRRLGYNPVETLVMATYTQIGVIIVNLINMLPLLIWDSSATVARHRALSANYMNVVELAVVALAFHQFFRIRLREEWWRLLLALALYYAAKELLLHLYGRLVVRIVLGL